MYLLKRPIKLPAPPPTRAGGAMGSLPLGLAKRDLSAITNAEPRNPGLALRFCHLYNAHHHPPADAPANDDRLCWVGWMMLLGGHCSGL